MINNKKWMKIISVHVPESVTVHPTPSLLTHIIFFKLWYVQNQKWDVISKNNRDELIYFDRFYGGTPKPV